LKHHGKPFSANKVAVEVIDSQVRTSQNSSSQVVEIIKGEGVGLLRIVVAQGIQEFQGRTIALLDWMRYTFNLSGKPLSYS
jgi:hypothetical protein